MDNEALETTSVLQLLAMEQNEMGQDINHTIMFVSHDSSLLLMPLTACSSVNQIAVPKTHPKPDPHTLILKSENLPKNQDEKEKYILIL